MAEEQPIDDNFFPILYYSLWLYKTLAFTFSSNHFRPDCYFEFFLQKINCIEFHYHVIYLARQMNNNDVRVFDPSYK